MSSGLAKFLAGPNKFYAYDSSYPNELDETNQESAISQNVWALKKASQNKKSSPTSITKRKVKTESQTSKNILPQTKWSICIKLHTGWLLSNLFHGFDENISI